MRFPRASGILLHPTSLPGRHGIGDLGNGALRFLSFLENAGQRLWQVLPLGPTGYGDSPYQSFSAFAGNPLLVSPELLADAGLLDPEDAGNARDFPENETDFDAVIPHKERLLDKARARWLDGGAESSALESLERFCAENASWLDDFALYMALRDAHGGKAWTEWAPELVRREADALAAARESLSDAIDRLKFRQYLFFSQWEAVRDRCRARGIRIMGDIPIYVAHDSADVWANQYMFKLDDAGQPEVVAGVPPDYFSDTGQLWGNPVYRWDRMAEAGYGWWISRLRTTLRMVDMVRLDHFRGFSAFWEVPAGEETAVNGRWVDCPGWDFFETVRGALGELPVVAENLGVITEDVEELRRGFGLPGMAVLQFAFGGGTDNPFLPHNYEQNLVAYTGTHDNDTTVGWWKANGGKGSTLDGVSARKERAFSKRYLNVASGRNIHWEFIRLLMGSVADTAIVPLQDVLGLGTEARMNMPGTTGGRNWRWRCSEDMLTDETAEQLHELASVYGRVDEHPAGGAE